MIRETQPRTDGPGNGCMQIIGTIRSWFSRKKDPSEESYQAAKRYIDRKLEQDGEVHIKVDGDLKF